MSLKVRLIPVLLLKNGLLVRSELFQTHQIIGNPINEVKRFNEWNVDELIYLDITRDGNYDMRRDDHRYKVGKGSMDVLKLLSKTCFMPLTWGGRLETIEQMHECFFSGADKITINTSAFINPSLINAASKVFGSQAVVVSIDVKMNTRNGAYEVYVNRGRQSTGLTPFEWAKEVERRGAGEILLQSIDHDGAAQGYDVSLIRQVATAVDIPVIACSGVGIFEDYVDGVKAGASAVAAANIWHFKELTDRQGKRALARAGVNVRFKESKNKRKYSH